jgi:hypothetical protein
MSDNWTANILDLLQNGTIEAQGLLPWSSNYTFLLNVCYNEQKEEAVYKPQRGERPLWDFPRGTLCHREQAAFVVSHALGWDIVPPTVLREGPHGIGTIQWYVPHDPEEHYFTFEGMFTEQVQRIQLFDVLINNADRKGGHVLLSENDKLWGIDHGIAFHDEYKLRSVVWEYAGIPIPQLLRDDLLIFQSRLANKQHPVTQELATLLSKKEIKALSRRLSNLIENNIFPNPGPGRHYPWPLV